MHLMKTWCSVLFMFFNSNFWASISEEIAVDMLQHEIATVRFWGVIATIDVSSKTNSGDMILEKSISTIKYCFIFFSYYIDLLIFLNIV